MRREINQIGDAGEAENEENGGEGVDEMMRGAVVASLNGAAALVMGSGE